MEKLKIVDQMSEAARDVFNHITSLDAFVADENAWLHIYPGYDHSQTSWFARIWTQFEMLTSDRN